MQIRASTPTSTPTNTGSTAPTTNAAIADAAASSLAAQPSANSPGARAHSRHAHGRHGHLGQALDQAMQDVGLADSGNRHGDEDHEGSRTIGNVKHDMVQFMHALFQAVKGESARPPVATGAPETDPKDSFSAGLSALITQAGSGTAPKALQDAFDKLVADFRPAAAATTPSPPVLTATVTDAPQASAPSAAATTESPAVTPSVPTLQALLTRLQLDLGAYGRRSAWTRPSTGNAVNLTA